MGTALWFKPGRRLWAFGLAGFGFGLSRHRHEPTSSLTVDTALPNMVGFVLPRERRDAGRGTPRRGRGTGHGAGGRRGAARQDEPELPNMPNEGRV